MLVRLDADGVRHVANSRHVPDAVFRHALGFASVHRPGKRDLGLLDLDFDLGGIHVLVAEQRFVHVLANPLVGTAISLGATPIVLTHAHAHAARSPLRAALPPGTGAMAVPLRHAALAHARAPLSAVLRAAVHAGAAVHRGAGRGGTAIRAGSAESARFVATTAVALGALAIFAVLVVPAAFAPLLRAMLAGAVAVSRVARALRAPRPILLLATVIARTGA